MSQFGDTHNFGRHVQPNGKNWIHKPRSTFWEELLLSRDSSFRNELDRILAHEPVVSCMPKLHFKADSGDSAATLMERVTVKPAITSCDLEYILEALGGLLAVTAWLGIEDLHNGNIVLGTDVRTGKFVLFPIDIEVIFSDVRLPSTIGLIHIDKNRQSISGAVSLFGLIRSANAKQRLAIPLAYMRTTQTLLQNAERIVNALHAENGILTAPIRIVARNTRDYLVHMRNQPPDNLIDTTELTEDELVQMRRGDVPYFFRTLADPRVRYFSSPDLTTCKFIKSQQWAATRAKATLRPQKIFAIRTRNLLLSEDSAMMIAAHFLPPDFMGEIQYRNFYLSASKRAVHIQFDGGILYKGARNWSDYLVPL
ncbi:MAG: hypothetical protein ABIT61_05545 [Steroidobacteraceae bacterium]